MLSGGILGQYSTHAQHREHDPGHDTRAVVLSGGILGQYSTHAQHREHDPGHDTRALVYATHDRVCQISYSAVHKGQEQINWVSFVDASLEFGLN